MPFLEELARYAQHRSTNNTRFKTTEPAASSITGVEARTFHPYRKSRGYSPYIKTTP